jgi:hypothetical protein
MNMAEPTQFKPATRAYGGTALSVESLQVAKSFGHLARLDDSSISSTSRTEKIDNTIAEIAAQYSVQNWDGYGAKAVSFGTLERAREFLLTLPFALPLPDVFAEVTGEIAFEWRTRHSSILVVSIADTGRLVFAGRFGSATTNGVDFFSEGIPSPVLAGIRRACHG